MNKRHTLTALAVIGMLTTSTMSYAFSYQISSAARMCNKQPLQLQTIH